MKKQDPKNVRKSILTLSSKNHGFLTAAEAFREGIQARDLYALRDDKTLIQIARGLFRHSDLPKTKEIELITLSIKSSTAVLSLESALAFHNLIAKSPHEIFISLPKGAQRPRSYPFPHRCIFISEPAFSIGIEIHKISGYPIRIYEQEKAIVDAFKFRNKIGIETCIEALKNWKTREDKSIKNLLSYSKICRMEKIIKPYLQALSIQLT